MKEQLIITHPGSAHFDDMTAVSLILAARPDTAFRVERREPTQGELDNPEVWVLDIGGRLEPERLNLDHHQAMVITPETAGAGAATDCPASFVLVAEYLGLLETMSIMPWWHFKDETDRFGIVRSSLKYNAGDPLVNQNPVQDWLTTKFAAEPGACLPQLKEYGTYIIGQARLLKSQLDFWKAAPRLVIAGVPAIIGETLESTGLDEFRRTASNPPDIVISWNRRGRGWRLFRFDDTPVDFSLIGKRPEIEFAAKTGFLAVTRERLPMDEVIALVSRAVTRP